LNILLYFAKLEEYLKTKSTRVSQPHRYKPHEELIEIKKGQPSVVNILLERDAAGVYIYRVLLGYINKVRWVYK
jgi:hypothetical protein